MLVTINTDASYCPIQKYGAFAFWAICNDFKICKSGVFRNKCISPHDAEAKCIINALKIICAHKGISKIIINTDSTNAIALFTKDEKHIRRYIGNRARLAYTHLQKRFDTLTKDINIEFRHVKAHSGVDDKRSFVNVWCDKEAKKQLRTKTKNPTI